MSVSSRIPLGRKAVLKKGGGGERDTHTLTAQDGRPSCLPLLLRLLPPHTYANESSLYRWICRERREGDDDEVAEALDPVVRCIKVVVQHIPVSVYSAPLVRLPLKLARLSSFKILLPFFFLLSLFPPNGRIEYLDRGCLPSTYCC